MGWHLYRQRYIYIDFGTFCHGHMLFNLFSFHDCRRVSNADARLTARDLQSTLFRNRFLSINLTEKNVLVLACCLADMLSGLILVFASPILFVPIIYYLVGFAPGLLSIVNTYLACTLAIAACTGCAYFISAISPDENLANLIAPAFLIPFFLYSGFFIPFPG